MLKKLAIVVLFVIGLGTVYSFIASKTGLPSIKDVTDDVADTVGDITGLG